MNASQFSHPVGVLKFLDTAHVKDLLALLRFAENPHDRVAGFRVMQLLPGVGPTSAQRVLDLMAARPDPSRRLVQYPGTLPDGADGWNGLVETLQQLKSGRSG